MICIVCPRGCHLTVASRLSENATTLEVTGNTCPRGAVYALEEIKEARRTVTATCPALRVDTQKVPMYAPRRVPVKTTAGIPRDRIHDLVQKLSSTQVKVPVNAGTVIIENWEDTGVSVVVTRTLA